MISKLTTYLQYGNRFCGIEHTTKKGTPIIVSHILKKKKTEVIVENNFEAHTVQEIVGKLPKKQHAVLVINNENVLSKTVTSEQKDNLKLVYKAFPNINLNEFYFEVSHQSSTHFISLCRKEHVDALIEEYENNGISIINISLGNTLISSILNFISTDDISTSNAVITLDAHGIEHIEKTDDVELKYYDINGLRASNEDVLSLSGALQSALGNNNSETNFEARKQSLLKTYEASRFFNQFLKFAGIFILMLLSMNFLFFNHYYNEVNVLKQTSQVNQNTRQKIISLSESVGKKQKMVDDILKSNASKSSFYINAIITSTPSSVLLTSLSYQPLERRIKIDKKIELRHNTIVIVGDSNDKTAFFEWINSLESKDWVKNAKITDYGDVSKSKSTFGLKIHIDNDQ